MTLARIEATGRGRLKARIEVEGWPEVFVSHASMAQVMGDARERVHTLLMTGMKLAARLQLHEGKIDAQAFRVELRDFDRSRKATKAMRTRANARTFLAADLTTTDVVATVFSTASFPNSGVFHVGTEAIAYTNKTATTFTGLTRGTWNTAAQAHFVQGSSAAFEADAGGLAYPAVTNRPETIEGRRAFLFLYGEGDSVTGDGSQRWQGVCTSSPRCSAGSYSFSIDPPTAILKQEIGGDVAQPVGIRGIYYPWNAPFVLSLSLCAGATSQVLGQAPTIVLVTGFYETDLDFCAALTTAIATATGAWGWPAGSRISAASTPSGFEIVYETPGAGTPRYVDVNPYASSDSTAGVVQMWMHDPSHAFDNQLTTRWVDSAGAEQVIVVNSRRYSIGFETTTPRAYFGGDSLLARRDQRAGVLTKPADVTTFPANRLYLGGLVIPSTAMFLSLRESNPDDGVGAFGGFFQANAVSSTNRYVECLAFERTFQSLTGNTQIRIGRKLAEGNVGDLITYLNAFSPDFANGGGMPLLRNEIQISPSDLDAALVARAVSDRVFAAVGAKATLEDIVGAELVAAALHWRMSGTGVLSVRRLRLASSAEVANIAIAEDDIVGGMPSIEEAAIWGYLSELHYRSGYNPVQDDWFGPELHARNVQSSAPNRAARTLVVGQRSVPRSMLGARSPEMDITQDEVMQIARVWLGMFGSPYDILTLRVSLKHFSAHLGDTVSVTSRFVPNDSGTLGLTAKLSILIGFAWEIESGFGTLELLMHSRNIGGYAPGFLVASQVNTGGNKWTLTLNVEAALSDYGLTQWFAIGDRVAVYEYDSVTPAIVKGTVDAVTASTISATFDGVWNPASGSGQWTFEPAVSTETTNAQPLARFCFGAESTGVIDYSGADADARVFSP